MLDLATPILLGLQLPDEGELQRVVVAGVHGAEATIGAPWRQDSRSLVEPPWSRK
jgi:hypothetical protein